MACFAKGGWVYVGKNTHICIVFTGVPGLMSNKFSANIEQFVGFIILYRNCDGSLKRRCCGTGNRFVARVGDN